MKQRKIVHHLEKERERFGAEASDAGAKFVAALEEVKPSPNPNPTPSPNPNLEEARLRDDCTMPRCLPPPQVKLREMTILDLQKKIAEGDARLKQQQNLYEASSD